MRSKTRENILIFGGRLRRMSKKNGKIGEIGAEGGIEKLKQ